MAIVSAVSAGKLSPGHIFTKIVNSPFRHCENNKKNLEEEKARDEFYTRDEVSRKLDICHGDRKLIRTENPRSGPAVIITKMPQALPVRMTKPR